jgi:hypothetical protein
MGTKTDMISSTKYIAVNSAPSTSCFELFMTFTPHLI